MIINDKAVNKHIGDYAQFKRLERMKYKTLGEVASSLNGMVINKLRNKEGK